MANLFVPITSLALLGGSLVYGESQITAEDSQAQVAPVIAQNANIWLLANDTTHDVCLITKTRRITATTASLDVDPTCDGVISASNTISVWQEDEAGNVTLGDNQGRTIIEFTIDPELGLTSVKGTTEKLSLTPNA